jgi:hypothetical protein
MGNNRTYIRDCVCNCTCHGNITYAVILCGHCYRCLRRRNCRIQDEDESIIDAWSLSSTVTMDNQPGAGRGLDQLFQFLGLRLERHMAVVLDRLGHGPAAVERRALKIIEKLHGEFRYVKQWIRKSVLKITTSSEIMQLQRELDNCCKLLVGHLRSVLRRPRCSHILIAKSTDRQRQRHSILHWTPCGNSDVPTHFVLTMHLELLD